MNDTIVIARNPAEMSLAQDQLSMALSTDGRRCASIEATE